MELVDVIIESIASLTLNKVRTALAMLGIIIGIGSVIALISMGQASQQAVSSQIEALGANLLTVSPGSQNAGAVRGAQGGATTLTLDDAKAILSSGQVSTIQTISPEYSKRAQVVAGRNNSNVTIIGVEPAYAEVHKVSIDSGAFIAQRDVDAMTKVAVIGPQVVTTLFPDGSDPLGQSIRVAGQALTVVGVTVSKGGTGFANQDNVIYVPLSTAQSQLFGVTYVTSIGLEAKNQDVMTDAQNQVGYLLLARHKLTDPTQADFSIFSQSDILATASQTTGTFTALLGGIAAISLLVGGIGIMNIMLVTVTERTREIGLRKALGAKKKIITSQFLIESIILTFAGGTFGVIFGIVASFIISTLLKLPFALSFPSMLLAIVVSGGIGILFGWYPAYKAANLQPIEALRYE